MLGRNVGQVLTGKVLEAFIAVSLMVRKVGLHHGVNSIRHRLHVGIVLHLLALLVQVLLSGKPLLQNWIVIHREFP